MRNQQQIRANAGWNAHEKCEWRSEKRPRTAGGITAMWSLRTCAPGCLHSQQAPWAVAALLLRCGSRSADSSELHYLCRRARDQVVAIEVLEALPPLGEQAAMDALDRTLNQTDEKRRSLDSLFRRRKTDCEVRPLDDRTDKPGASRGAERDSSSLRGPAYRMGG